MANEPRADIKSEVAPKEPVPSSEQKTTEPNVEESKTGQKSVSSEPKAGGSELPEDTSDRTTEQFDKLKAKNTELQDKLSQFETKEPIIGNLATPPVVPKTQSTVDRFYNPETGEIDVQALKSFEDRLSKAEIEVADTRLEAMRSSDAAQEKEALEVYPDLKSDKDFRRKARAILTDSMVNPQDYGDKPLSLKEAADIVKAPASKEIKAAEKAGADKALEGLTEKEQASLEATGRSDRRKDLTSIDDLKSRTRKGDIGAVIERMKGLQSA